MQFLIYRRYMSSFRVLGFNFVAVSACGVHAEVEDMCLNCQCFTWCRYRQTQGKSSIMDDHARQVEDNVVTLLDTNAQGEALNPA